ncbi:hypothetical protein [Nitrososphaera sp.]|uniref:hypothetical protein n=1 Tax=Nitrososphaera sp. TaxID=1971748 RepID=UPI00307DBD4B
MHCAKITKSSSAGCRLELYGPQMQVLESESFADLYTLNFRLQTLASKHKISEGLLVVHDKDANAVDISLAKGENAFFVS